MAATIYGLAVNDFFNYWLVSGSNFILAQAYNSANTYNINDIVYYAQVPYISLINANTIPPLPMMVPPLWNQIALNSRSLPVQSGMVASAMQAAQSEFNYAFFPQTYNSTNQPIPYNALPPVDTLTGYTNAQIGFIMLASHYLCCDLFAAQFAGQAASVNRGISVGGMSQSFQFPANIESSRIFSRENTEYGRKYNQMIAPFERSATMPLFFYSNR